MSIEVYPALTGPDNRLRFMWALPDPDRESSLSSGVAFTTRSDAHADAARWRDLATGAEIVDRDYPHRGGSGAARSPGVDVPQPEATR